GGLARLKDGRFQRFTAAQGLGAESIRVIYEDRGGTLWAGTSGGLYRLQGDRFLAYTLKHGLYDEVVSQVMEDGQGNLWIGSSRGIFRMSRADLDAVAQGQRPTMGVTI